MTLAFLPSPSQGVWHLGPVPIRAYAFCILAGILAAIWLTGRRWEARGHHREDVVDIAIWAVPFGLVGGRLYHVLTDPELYFERGEQPIRALYVWDGGLGIWGAVALGAVGAWIACRRKGVKLADFADAMAPGLVLAQAIGRWGNYFNQELYGKPSGLPWAIRIDPAHRPAATPDVAFYQPTFLYESIWDAGVAALLLWIDRRWQVRRGRLFAIYVACYTAGRAVVEALRDDPANRIAGLRLNDWTSLFVFLGALVYLWATRERSLTDSALAGVSLGDGVPGDVVPADVALAEGTPTVVRPRSRSLTSVGESAERDVADDDPLASDNDDGAGDTGDIGDIGDTGDRPADPTLAATSGDPRE